MLTFNHSGKIGDLLYSLYFCNALLKLAKQTKFNFNIQYNVPEILRGRERENVRLTKEDAQSIKSLLETQPYINEVTISDTFEMDDDLKVNLDNFRKFHLNFSDNFIAQWYYNLTVRVLERNYQQQIIFVDADPNLKGKVIIAQTKKYINPFIDLKVLEPYKDILVFIGLDDEYKTFKEKYFTIPKYEVKNCLDIAKAVIGADLTISNQNGIFAIAELMKSPRLLIPPQYEKIPPNSGFDHEYEPGPCNVFCHGGWFEYINYTLKLQSIMQQYFSKKENKNE